MFFSRTLNNSLNCIHKRVLCLIHDNCNSSFQDILQILNEKTIHKKLLQHLAKEIYKFFKGLSPPITNHFFSFRDTSYNLGNFQCVCCDNKKTVKYRTETIAYRGPQIWNLIPESIINTPSFNTFLKKLKNGMLTCVHIEFVRHIQRLAFI